MQWFRGTFEGSYVGTPSGQPFLSPHAAGNHFQLRIYRAAVQGLTLTDPPAEQTEASSQEFRQERVDDARVYNVRGQGSHYHGPIFDLRVSRLSFTHLTYKDGLSYGKIEGVAQAWLELPPEPQIELSVDTYADGDPEPTPELVLAPPPARRAAPGRIESAQPSVGGSSLPLDPELDALPADAPEMAPTARRASAASSGTGRPTALPLVALASAVALGLWASCGAEPALLWVVFMLPTLLCRKLFHGVLADSQGIRGFGLFLVMVQLACVAVLLESWWSADCKQMMMLPLIGLVAVIFPAGLLPSAAPLLCNAAGLALVLGMWCGGPSNECGESRDRSAPSGGASDRSAPSGGASDRSAPSGGASDGRKAPSVQHPGVPRTNEDGSWPKRPPG